MGLLETKIEPDINSLIATIKRKNPPARVHNIELFLDQEIRDSLCDRFELNKNLDSNEKIAYHQKEIRLHRLLGYDAFRIRVAGTPFQTNILTANDTTTIKDQQRPNRDWSEEHTGPIQSRQDFENYPWPDPKNLDYEILDWLEENLPENMGVYDLTAHILEMLTFLLGYETLCFKLADDTALVDAILEKVGQYYVEFTRILCGYSCMKIIWGSDDMGFRTGTLVSPKTLKEKILPWHKRCAEVAHKNNRLYLLHACGQLSDIIDDLIDNVRIDAKHSYEDTILPVTEAKKLFGNRIAILGGIDVDFLCRSNEKEIRTRIRNTLEICTPDGGYCLGTGNTVANYIPIQNYLTMLDEGRRFFT